MKFLFYFPQGSSGSFCLWWHSSIISPTTGNSLKPNWQEKRCFSWANPALWSCVQKLLGDWSWFPFCFDYLEKFKLKNCTGYYGISFHLSPISIFLLLLKKNYSLYYIDYEMITCLHSIWNTRSYNWFAFIFFIYFWLKSKNRSASLLRGKMREQTGICTRWTCLSISKCPYKHNSNFLGNSHLFMYNCIIQHY